MRKLQLKGQRFGRLLVIEAALPLNGRGRWRCKCNCGNEKLVITSYLTSGDTKSCGCWELENQRYGSITHGQAKGGYISREFLAWSKAKQRCYNINDHKYHDYGERGIRMCDRWIDNFTAFYKDMGSCPMGLTLDRIDVNGNYEPENCRWATKKEQSSNRRNNINVSFQGNKITLKELSRVFGVCYQSLWAAVRLRSEEPISAATRLSHDR